MITYSLSKSFVHNLALNLSKDEGFQSKNVLCLLPPIMVTPSNIEAMPNEDRSGWVHPGSVSEIVYMMTQS